MSDDLKWWGYQHADGSIHVKRYFDQKDLIEASQSDFVMLITRPFGADNREDAMTLAKERLGL